MDVVMQSRARVVIVGSGIVGASIAYHLAQLGWHDVAVLEQGELASGTTSHAPGLVGQLRSSMSLTRMLMYSVELYRTLSVDGVPGYVGEGSLRLASSRERWQQVRQQHEFARRAGLEAHVLSAAETARLFPQMSLEGVHGALHIPSDGSATATVLAQALTGQAQARGVTFYPRTRVQNIETSDGRVQAVQTDGGRIETEILVAAAGIWSPALARMAGVTLPLVPMHHQYVETEPLPQLGGRTVPNLRDPDKLIYTRQRQQSLIVGGYERTPQPYEGEAIPDRADPTVQPFVSGQFESLRRAATERIPLLAGASLARQVNGLEAFTPDGEFLLGPVPEVHGFWSASGFCAHGVSSAGGVGKVLAEWIVHGDPGLDVAAMSLSRFRGVSFDRQSLREATCKIYGTYYDMQPSS